MRLVGVSLFGDDAQAPLVDIAIDNGLIAAIEPSSAATSPRRLAMPALANAHDHARPLSPTSFGGAGKPLETWLLRLAAMPAIDPYLGALAAFGRAARGGAASVMAHYTRLHGPMSPIDEVSEVARAARDVGIRVTFAMFMRDRNPLVYGPSEPVLAAMPIEARRIVEAQFLYPMPSAAEQVARVEAIAAAVESPTSPSSSARAARNGVRTRCLARSLTPRRAAAGASICIFSRRSISAPSPTAPIRKESWRISRHRAAQRASDARPLRPCAPRRTRSHRRGRRDHRHQSKLEPASALGDRADRRGDQARLPRRPRRRFLGARRGRRYFA